MVLGLLREAMVPFALLESAFGSELQTVLRKQYLKLLRKQFLKHLRKQFLKLPRKQFLNSSCRTRGDVIAFCLGQCLGSLGLMCRADQMRQSTEDHQPTGTVFPCRHPRTAHARR